jgi:hypothetical protein
MRLKSLDRFYLMKTKPAFLLEVSQRYKTDWFAGSYFFPASHFLPVSSRMISTSRWR